MSLNLTDGPLAIFRTFSRLLEAILRLADAIQALARVQGSAAPAMERLDALELSRHMFEAEVAGVLLEAKGKLRAASNAEARERQMRKSYEADFDSVPEDGNAGPEASPILPDNVEASEAERLSALRVDVAPTNKTAALAHKFGR